MRAQVIERFGGPDVFRSVDLPDPEVIPGHVLIRVAATSVNPVDTKIRSGVLAAIAPDMPAVLHGDVAGTIVTVGAGVDRFAPGEDVYACAGGVKGLGGALAGLMLADADLVARKPATLSMREAASLPLVTITAWNGLVDRARVRPGQTVLIHASTGGVGQIGIQLAKWAGATVFATGSSEEKLRIARDLGAGVAINYREQDVAAYVAEHTGGRGFDVVFDTVGGDNLARSFEAIALNGTVVCTAARTTADLSPLHAKGATLHVIFMLIPMLHRIGRARHGEILTEVARIADDGAVRPLIDPRTFTFDQVGAAHAHLESGQAIGKVVLTNDAAA
ncbi:MAG: zinc-dependent alcohol dehydrogenase family protein [Thermomicrobiales bacterium]